MKYLIIILAVLFSVTSKAQQRFPNGFPTQTNLGWNKWGYAMSDSGLIVANRDTNWLAKYSGTVVFRPGDKKFYYFDSTTLLWNQFGTVIDTTSLSNRINLKLNISDTIGQWLAQSTRLVDTLYRVNDSTIGYTIKGSPYTFQILGSASGGGGGGSGTVTSVALSMPSGFTVTGSPITSSGTFSIAGAGTTLQYIRGNGTLGTFDTAAIPDFYLKVRGLLTGTSPITFNQTTGAIGITNANTSGTKGAASFNSASFSDNGSGLISLNQPVAPGTCINCDITWGVDGRPTSYASGTPPNFVNAPGAGDTLSILDTLKRLNPGYGIDHAVTDYNITHSVDTSEIATQYDLTQTANISNTSLTANGDYSQNWNNKQLRIDSIASSLFFRGGGIGSTGTVRKEFSISWPGNSFANQFDQYSILSAIRKADNSADSLRLGLLSGGTGVLSMGHYDVASSANNTFISYSYLGLINISAKDSIWIKGATPAATADSILGVLPRSGGISRIVKIPIPVSSGATNNTNIGSAFRWLNEGTQEIKTVSSSNTIIWDSTSTANTLTAKADTSVLATQYDLTQIVAVPGGSNTQVQYNDEGSFGGDGGLTYNSTSNELTTDSITADKGKYDTLRVKVTDPTASKSAYFFGTSITEGYYTQNAAGGLDTMRRWSTYVSRSLGWTEVNYGVPSQTMQSRSPVVTNMIDQGLPLVPTYNSATDTAIILEYNINDCTHTGQGETNYNTTNFITDYTRVIDTIKARGWPDAQIYIIASNYVDTALNLFNNYTNQLAYYNATKTVATNEGVNLIDVFENSFINRTHYFYSDGLHPSNVGHSFYAVKVLQHLGASVKTNDQTVAANGPVELQKIRIKQTDTTAIDYQVVGLDPYNNAIKIPNGYFVENNPLVTQYGGINMYGDIKGTRFIGNMVQAKGARVATGLTGSGLELYWDGTASNISSLQETPSVAWRPLNINAGGSFIGIGTSQNGLDGINAISIKSTGYIRAMGSTPASGTSGGEVVMGYNSTYGAFYAFDYGTLQAKPLSVNHPGGNVMIGTTTDNTVGKLQVNGKLTVATHTIAANSDSAVVRVLASGEYQYAKINGGITTLNTLTAATQTFATGTSGSDFNISSVTDVHTFNFPTASASNRGLLSTADWSTFNGKVGSINSQTGATQTIVGGTGITVNSSADAHTISITGAGDSYNRYVALVSQTGTSDPTVTVLENTIGGTIVWTRSTTGTYNGTLTGAFVAGSTWIVCTNTDESLNIGYAKCARTNNDVVTLRTQDITFSADDDFTNIAIEIRIYPAP